MSGKANEAPLGVEDPDGGIQEGEPERLQKEQNDGDEIMDEKSERGEADSKE